ncbi:glycosyl transferase, group 1 family protein [Oceaniovalibus guishaninsula JLT2003]|uniref:Glycosyl transferase, group 1 family protein n=1 Tax=Oceaniovalibus guishaninsula JLT2003 TaxID=1231392 RepID=K2I308_9RHOB|nr:glycosyltransferase [Oceaniovalibus guishaninsula]EKE43255.1 glycosyl transferase, group 1 family protein [Oceaniovalibus guishaninsula JLT2003]
MDGQYILQDATALVGNDVAERPVAAGAGLTVGYVMNTYPLVSTTFIGREIRAIEAMGATVRRYAIRHWTDDLVDDGDRRERGLTRYLLTGPRRDMLRAVLSETAANPRGMARAFGCALRLMRAGGGPVRQMAYLAEAIVLRRAAAADGVMHLHAHFSSNATSVAMLARALGGPPYSFTVHGPTEFFNPHENALGAKVAGAAFVACISHFARAQVMIFAARKDWPKLRIVHCGVAPGLYDAPRGAPGQRLLFVGRLARVKGVAVLLDAFAALRAGHPDAHLTLAGDGPERATLEGYARDLGIADAVTFTGYLGQDAVAGRLAQTDIFVLPSFAEGVPVVLMEAMAAGLPVIGPQVAGVPELVEEGVSGYLVPPGDTDTLTDRIARLLDDPALRARMGQAGRARVARDFDADREAAWLARLVEGSLQGGLPQGLRPEASCR